jgi:hypothetical protein
MADLGSVATPTALSGFGDSRVIPGDEIYVVSEDADYVYRLPPPSLVADGKSVVKSIFLAGNWIQKSTGGSNLFYMQQLNWFIDPVNGNDANDGATAATALQSDAERQRRMGSYPIWSSGAYHLRYLNDLLPSDTFVLAGRRETNSQIFVHGSTVDHQGKATLFTGVIDVLGTLNRATGTNESWLITSNALPVSWTASGLLNKRIRLTSGAATGAISGVMKDLGAKQARVCQFRAPVSYTVPVNPSGFTSTSTPVATNTFVVESLVCLPTVLITLDSADNFSTNLGSPVIFDSVVLGINAAQTLGDFVLKSSDVIVLDGCGWTMFDLLAECIELLISGSIAEVSANLGANVAILLLAAGFSATTVSSSAGGNNNVTVQSDFMVQGARFLVNGPVGWLRGAVFDAPGPGAVQMITNGRFDGSTQAGSFFCWGKGNAVVGLAVGVGTVSYLAGQVAGFTITGTGGDFSVRAVTTIRPFDNTTGAYVATAATTWAILAAAVGGGTGFGGNVNDPVSGGRLVSRP